MAQLAVWPARAEEESTPSTVVVDPIEVRARHEHQPADTDPVSPDAQRGLDEPAFVTEVRLDERAGETTTVAELLSETLGVKVRSLGGLGSFSAISIRGADPGHTTVLVDGVPLSRIASVAVDIGRFSSDSFSTIEVYRGAVPAELGGAMLGGALNLVTRVGPPPSGAPWTLSVGAGSFGATHGYLRWQDGTAGGSHGWHLAADYSKATGDFTYFNDNGTNLNRTDDGMSRRANNHFDQVDAVARYRYRAGDTEIEGGGRWAWRSQGIPGSASVQSQRTSLATLSQLADIRVSRQRLGGSPRLRGTASGFAIAEWQRYRDLASEVGLGVQHRLYRSLSAGATAHVTADAGAAHLLSASVEGRVDRFRERDALRLDQASGQSLRSQGARTSGAFTLADEWASGNERVLVQPALRADWLHTVPLANAQAAGDPEQMPPRTELFLSPRVAGRVRLHDGLALKGSVGRYFRAPTVIELFGDRGFLVGNPALRAETGLSADVGLVLAPPRALDAVDRVYVESVAFARKPKNAIAFVTTSGLATIALNLGDASIMGTEVSASARIARLATISAHYMFLHTRQHSPLPSYDRKPLPQRPRHSLYGRIDLAHQLGDRTVTLWSDCMATTGNFLDAAGLSRVPARRLVGAGVKLEATAGLLVGVEVKNLLDQRIEMIPLHPPPGPHLTQIPRPVADFFGYPLPGRALYLTAEWQPGS